MAGKAKAKRAKPRLPPHLLSKTDPPGAAQTEAKNGRPPIYTEQLAAEVCRRISNGESLRAVCRSEGMPAASTVLKWCREIAGFSAQYARAREDLLEHWADQIVDIADDTSKDTVEVKNDDGQTVREMQNTEWINRSRLRVDTRKWLMSKLLPRKYGEKLELAGDPERPLGATVPNESVLAERLAAHLAKRTGTP